MAVVEVVVDAIVDDTSHIWTPNGIDSFSPPIDPAIFGDDSDNSYAFRQGEHPDLIVAVGGFSLPAGASIVRVRPNVRQATNSGWPTVHFHTRLNGVNGADNAQADAGGSQTNYVGAWENLNPSGAAWTEADVNDLQIFPFVHKDTFHNSNLTEVWLDVEYNFPADAPVVSAPTGTVTDTNQPDVVFAYSDTESDPQSKYHVKVFTEADYTSGTFDADTFPAQWDSGEVASADTTVQVGEALPADVTFKAFVRYTDDAFGDRWTDWVAGPEFTILASGRDKPGRVFFGLTSGPGSSGGGFWEFDDDNREGSFRFKSAPLRAPDDRQVEIREVQVYCKSYDAASFVRITVNGTARTKTMTVPGRHQLTFLFRERNEVLDVLVESEAGAPDTSEAPTIEVVRIGWRSGGLMR